jgi:hypothetical protein
MGSSHAFRVIHAGYRMVRSMSSADVRNRLAPVGLDDAEVERGKALFAAAQAARPHAQRVKLAPIVSELLEWGRAEVPVIHAVLGDVAPDIEARVFDGVTFNNTSDDLLALENACQRALALETSTDAGDQAAFAALVKHGVSHAALSHVLEQSIVMAHFDSVDTGSSQEAYADAIDALAAFHKKWSRIARTRIKDRRVLRMMGIGRFGSVKAAADAAADAATVRAADSASASASDAQSTAAPADASEGVANHGSGDANG